MEETRSSKGRKKIVVSGIGGIAGILICGGAFAAATLIRNRVIKRKPDSNCRKPGVQGLRSLLLQTSPVDIEHEINRYNPEPETAETPFMEEKVVIEVNVEKKIPAYGDERIDENHADSVSLNEDAETEDEDEDVEEGDEEETEREGEESEGTGDSSIESNSEAIWPTECIEQQLSMLKESEIFIEKMDKETSNEIEEADAEVVEGGVFETKSSAAIDKESGFELLRIASRLWLLLALALLLLFAHCLSAFYDLQLPSSS